MIDQYNRIQIFIPEAFKNILLKKDLISELQEFANYCSQELEVSEKYKIKFSSDINNDMGRCDNKNKIITLNEKILNLYKQYITAPDNLNLELQNKLKNYSYQICSTIVHEIKHVKQYELYTKEYNEMYKNIEAPVNNDMLYFLQKTEREAYTYELEEIEKLYEYFTNNNYINEEEKQDFKEYIENLELDIKEGFDFSIQQLVENKLIKNKDIKELDIIKFEENIKIYKKISKLIDRETSFVIERNDHIKNENEYIKNDIAIDNKHKLQYKIKNNNGKWNIYLEVYNKNIPNPTPNDNPKFGFTLDGNICRINTTWLYETEKVKLNEKEILKYVNAFIELYHTKITSVQISDFACNLDYKQTTNFKKQNKSILNKFILQPNVFTKTDYKNALDLIKNNLTIDNIIKLNTTINNTKKKIDIVR